MIRAVVASLVFVSVARAVDYSALAPPTASYLDLAPVAQPESPRGGRVVIVGAEWCAPCVALKPKVAKALDDLKSKGWNMDLFVVLDITRDEQLVEALVDEPIQDLPFVAFVDNGSVIRHWQSGCNTPMDAWTLGWLATGKSQRPAPKYKSTVRLSGYPIRGNWWSVDGRWRPTRTRLIAHLSSSNHGFSSSFLNGLTLEELHSLHSDDHEGRVQMAYVNPSKAKTQFVTASSVPSFGASCPTGGCPMPFSGGRRGRR